MFGRSLGLFVTLFVVGPALWLGEGAACWGDGTAADGVLELEIIKRPQALPKDKQATPEAAIRRALDTRIRARFVEATLNDVCGEIGKQFGIPVVLDQKALSDEGLDPDPPVSCSMNDVRLRSWLEFMLSYYDLTWTIRNEVLLITTETANREMLAIRVYDVTDLAAVPEFADIDIDALVEVIATIVSPDTWNDVGGEGGIVVVEGHGIRAIVISQTLGVHDQIGKLLAELRAHISKKQDGTAGAAETRDVKNPAGNKVLFGKEAIRRALQKKVDLNFTETPLDQVVEQLKKLLQIEIQLHCQSLGDEGIDIDTPINCQISGISAAAALERLLCGIDLSYTIKDNFLLILTTCWQMENTEIEVYDVADLVDGHGDLDYLIEAITGTVACDAWSDVGGEGNIVSFENAGLRVLVVGSYQEVHDDIKKLLADLRKVQRKVGDGPGVSPGMEGHRLPHPRQPHRQHHLPRPVRLPRDDADTQLFSSSAVAG